MSFKRPTTTVRACATVLALALAAIGTSASRAEGPVRPPSPAELAVSRAREPALVAPARFAAARPPAPPLVRRPVALVGRAPWSTTPAPPPGGPARFPVGGRFDLGDGQARFGAARSGRVHAGQDVFARPGTPLVAVRDAVVLDSGSDGGRGNYVGIYSPQARRTYVYLHMLRPAPVRKGQRVRAGRRVGAVGCSGSCSGDHVHFEVRLGRGLARQAIDPLPILRNLRRD